MYFHLCTKHLSGCRWIMLTFCMFKSKIIRCVWSVSQQNWTDVIRIHYVNFFCALRLLRFIGTSWIAPFWYYSSFGLAEAWGVHCSSMFLHQKANDQYNDSVTMNHSAYLCSVSCATIIKRWINEYIELFVSPFIMREHIYINIDLYQLKDKKYLCFHLRTVKLLEYLDMKKIKLEWELCQQSSCFVWPNRRFEGVIRVARARSYHDTTLSEYIFHS